ncbi:MAG TPA: multidrug effflux MFS transporter [Gammaproteobacteria bacterium]|nr:multidrug effflux MFS transporter [Gammaproteobacteria bacterium]
MSHFRLALLLGAAIAIGPLAMDAYLPAFPEIAAALGVPAPQVGLSVSVYLAGMAAGHLVGGPLSDRYGRRAVLLGGLAVFVGGSLGIAASTTLGSLLLWRLIHALGAGFCIVSIPAITRDRTSGTESARLFSLIALITFIAPATAPAIGTLILWFTDWPGIFIFLAVYGAAIALLLYLNLFRGTPPAARTREPLHTLLTNYAQVLRHGPAMRLLLVLAMAFSIMMIYITHASLLFQEHFALSKEAFSLIMAGSVAAMAALNVTNRWLLRYWEPMTLLRAAITLQAAALLYLTALSATEPGLALFLPGLILAIATFGAAMPNTFSAFLEFFPHISATATALMGAMRFTIAGLLSALSSMLADGSLLPIVGLMTLCALVGLALVWVGGGPARAEATE